MASLRKLKKSATDVSVQKKFLEDIFNSEICYRYVSYNSGSNRARNFKSASRELLARLLPELYSIRSNYYYQLWRHNFKLTSCVDKQEVKILCSLDKFSDNSAKRDI